jgi:dihydrofolate synthase/folylpolyglutamate synthase
VTYDEAVAYLDQHAGRGVRPGLERIEGVLDAMGNPHRSYPVIHVTGSKGKTSVSKMITAIAAAHGLSVGTYTSPHLEAVEERLAYNNVVASGEEFARAIADAAAFDAFFEEGPAEGRLTYFEFITAAAFAWFAERAVDLAVVEVGLGGRLDATNVVDSAVAVITSIALEHTGYLGETLEAIAGEKAAILKSPGSLVTGELPPEAAAVAAARAGEFASPHLAFGREFQVADEIRSVGGWLVSVDGIFETYENFQVPLHGRHQLQNVAIAVAATEEFFGRALDLESVRSGLGAIEIPGRLEVVSRAPVVVLDGAHTPESIDAGAAALDEEFPPFLWKVVFGALSDKNLEGMLGALDGVVGELFAVSASSERAISPEAIAEAAASVLEPGQIHVAGSIAEGLAAATEAAGADGAVLVTGSMYVVGEARSLLGATKRS